MTDLDSFINQYTHSHMRPIRDEFGKFMKRAFVDFSIEQQLKLMKKLTEDEYPHGYEKQLLAAVGNVKGATFTPSGRAKYIGRKCVKLGVGGMSTIGPHPRYGGIIARGWFFYKDALGDNTILLSPEDGIDDFEAIQWLLNYK